MLSAMFLDRKYQIYAFFGRLYVSVLNLMGII